MTGYWLLSYSWAFLGLAFLLSNLAPLAQASCECGFTTANPYNNSETWLFLEMLETDFGALRGMASNTDWVRQEYNVSAEDGRGEHGKAFMANNVEPGPQSSTGEDDNSDNLGRAVLQLKVGASLSDDAVPVAEVDSARLDLHWGSFRTGMKVTSTNGTCAAFFWYFNDTQEIDMEFLSREFEPELGIYPISLVIQSRESKEAGYDASKTGTYQRVNLTFDPTADFHEYRFDYLPGKVLFYADSAVLAVIEGEEVPSVGGHLILQHWSNGNPLWSGGPPASDAFLDVSYVKAYFNTSDQIRLSNQSHKCHSFAPEMRDVCAIPDVTAAEAKTGGHFFTRPESDEDDEKGGRNHDEEDTSDSEESCAPAWLTGAGMGMVLWLVVVIL